MNRLSIACFVLSFVGTGACSPADPTRDGGGADASTEVDAVAAQDAFREIPTATSMMQARAVAFNPAMVPLGRVSAIAEEANTTVFFGSTGVSAVRSGVLIGSNAMQTSWLAATMLPGVGDAFSVLAADASGNVLRVRTDGVTEVVSDRYGLARNPVRWLGHAGGTLVGFATATGISIADGTSIRRFMDGAFATYAASPARFSAANDAIVKTIDANTGTTRTWMLAGTTAVAFDAAGMLVVAAGDVLWRESASGELFAVWRAPAPIVSLASAATRLWLIAGSKLGTLTAAGVSLATNVSLAEGSTLRSALRDEVWVLAPSGPLRFAVDTTAQDLEAQWRATIQPIFASSCGRCHSPGQQSPDLSTFAGWRASRTSIDQRVVQQMGAPMPPDLSLSMADRMAIGQWLMGL